MHVFLDFKQLKMVLLRLFMAFGLANLSNHPGFLVFHISSGVLGFFDRRGFFLIV